MTHFRLFVVGAIAALALGACASPPTTASGPTTPATTPATPTTHPGPAQWQDEMLASVNRERAANGVGPLVRCAALDRSAQAHSVDQAAHDNMSHTGSDGSDAGQRMTAAGYRGWLGWGENVAVGYRSVSAVMSGWMNSDGHRRNILNRSYEHIGFGLAGSGSGSPYWTQNFGRSGTC